MILIGSKEIDGPGIEKFGRLMEKEDLSLSCRHFVEKVSRDEPRYYGRSLIFGALIVAGYDGWEEFNEAEKPLLSEITEKLITPFMEANPDFLENLPLRPVAAAAGSPGDSGDGAGQDSSPR